MVFLVQYSIKGPKKDSQKSAKVTYA
jgi:hypothetical protein